MDDYNSGILDGFTKASFHPSAWDPKAFIVPTLIGAGVGAVGGALIKKKPEQSRLKRILAGAGIGAAAGASVIPIIDLARTRRKLNDVSTGYNYYDTLIDTATSDSRGFLDANLSHASGDVKSMRDIIKHDTSFANSGHVVSNVGVGAIIDNPTARRYQASNAKAQEFLHKHKKVFGNIEFRANPIGFPFYAKPRAVNDLYLNDYFSNAKNQYKKHFADIHPGASKLVGDFIKKVNN